MYQENSLCNVVLQVDREGSFIITNLTGICNQSCISCHLKTRPIEIFKSLYGGRGFLYQEEGCEVTGVGDCEYHGVQPQEQYKHPGAVHARIGRLWLAKVETKSVVPAVAKFK